MLETYKFNPDLLGKGLLKEEERNAYFFGYNCPTAFSQKPTFTSCSWAGLAGICPWDTAVFLFKCPLALHTTSTLHTAVYSRD